MIDVRQGMGLFFALAVGAVLASCAGRQIADDSASTYLSREPPPQEIQREYVLGPGDTLQIEFYYNDRLNRKVTIRPDGKITLPLKGEVEASQITPERLSRNISDLFSDVLKDPTVTVTLEATSRNNVVYVMGEVRKPDYYLLESPTTVTQILARAGVDTATANLETVLVISRNDQGKPVGHLINVGDVLEKADFKRDVILKRYDIVYVSRSSIAKADLFVDQYINRLIPNLFRVNYSYTNVHDRGNP